MPKFPSVTPRKLIQIIKHLGFKLDHTTGSHFIFYNSKTKRRAVVPYHLKDLPKGTLTSILRDAEIGRKELKDFLR